MGFQCSSASRKFLNTLRAAVAKNPAMVSVLFSEPKIPQSAALVQLAVAYVGFSALQRAENSSIYVGAVRALEVVQFQCSSASRKFLNTVKTSPD